MRRLYYCLPLILLGVATAVAEDSLVGKRVYLKLDAKPAADGKEVPRNVIDPPSNVKATDGDRLDIVCDIVHATVGKNDVVPEGEALAYATVQIDSHPKSAQAWCLRGIVRIFSEKPSKAELAKAIKDFDEALKLDPKDARALNFRGICWKKQGEWAKAQPDFAESIRLDSKYAFPLNESAWIYATCPDKQFRDGAKGVEFATKACELTDWKKWGHIDTLAAAYAEKGDFAKAIEWQKKAMDMTNSRSSKKGCEERLALYQANKIYTEGAEVEK